MDLTAEQRAEIDRQHREHPGGRVTIEFTPEQRAEWERLCDLAASEREQAADQLRRMDSACAEQSFRGELRRAIRAARRGSRPRLFDQELGLDPVQIDRFLAAEEDLPLEVVERLIGALELHLVPIEAP